MVVSQSLALVRHPEHVRVALWADTHCGNSDGAFQPFPDSPLPRGNALRSVFCPRRTCASFRAVQALLSRWWNFGN